MPGDLSQLLNHEPETAARHIRLPALSNSLGKTRYMTVPPLVSMQSVQKASCVTNSVALLQV